MLTRRTTSVTRAQGAIRVTDARTDAAGRLSFRQRGYTKAWDKASVAFRTAHPLCRICEAKGLVVPSQVTDHIVPHRGDPALMWDRANWQALCKRCHDMKTATEDGGVGSSHPTWLPKPACSVVIVCGPPGAGKTTYCRDNAKRDDVIIDLDECFRDVCGVHGHDADRIHLNAALRWRNKQLAALASRTAGTAYLIVSAPTKAEREWWCAVLNATAVLLDPGASVCAERTKPERRALVSGWYSKAGKRWEPPYSREIGADGWPVDPKHPANR